MRDDWVSPWWQAVCLPRTWDVGGFVVPSLSVWHVFALQNVANRYVFDGPKPMIDDAASLLLFASRDMAEGLDLIHNAAYRQRNLLKYFRKLRRKKWDVLHAACTEYVSTCMRTVSRWQKSTSKPCAVPLCWHLVSYLVEGQPYPDAYVAAWNMPFAVAKCLYDAKSEMNGDDSIMSIAAQEMEDNWDDYKDNTEIKTVKVG
jgi:hypothetical protein